VGSLGCARHSHGTAPPLSPPRVLLTRSLEGTHTPSTMLPSRFERCGDFVAKLGYLRSFDQSVSLSTTVMPSFVQVG
jgi:hypothetical protein